MPKVKINCETCGEEKERYVSPSRGVETFKFCSHACKGVSYWNRKMSEEQKLKISRSKTKIGFSINVDGYKELRPYKGKRQYEHRKIMGEHLKRELLSDELVHHINGNKQDNRINNMEIVTRSEHIGLHRDKLTAGRCLGI